jgi:hypothetical protein
MTVQDFEMERGLGAAPDWLVKLIGAVRAEAVQPKDPGVRSLWDLLRQRRLLGRSPWLRALLHRIWRQGLAAHPRPRTSRRLMRLLQRWGVLAAATAGPGVATRGVLRPFRPVQVRPLHPVAVRPVRAVRVAARAGRGAR